MFKNLKINKNTHPKVSKVKKGPWDPQSFQPFRGARRKVRELLEFPVNSYLKNIVDMQPYKVKY